MIQSPSLPKVKMIQSNLAWRSRPPRAPGALLPGPVPSAALALAALSLLATRAEADPFFNDVTEFSLPSPQPCVDPVTGEGEGCYTNWLALSDLDGDGDLDIVTANGGGYYELGNAEPSVIYFNDGTGAFRDVTASAFAGMSSRLRQVSIGDIDGDGDLDLYQPGGYGVDADKLWIQISPGVFADQATTRLPSGISSRAGSSHLADLDGDGNLDLVIGDWGDASATGISRVALFINDGSGVLAWTATQAEPSLGTLSIRLPPTLPADGASGSYWGHRPIDLDTADVDGDFDLDILVNHRNGMSRILLNDGQANFSDGNGFSAVANADSTTTVASNYPEKRGPYVYNQELCDIDNDGDLDLLLDNAGARPEEAAAPAEDAPPENFTQILVNDGSGRFTDESRARIFGEPGADDNAVKCVDVNSDGHYDLLVASLTNAREKLLLNDGKGIFNYVADAFPVGLDPTLGIDVGDLDSDGLFDVVTGQGEADPKVNRVYRGMGAALPDTLAPIFRSVQTPLPVPNEPIVFHVAVRDSVTSETGEAVKDVTVAFTTGSSSDSVRARFIGGDLFRVVIPAQPSGTTLTVTPSATDRQGNVGWAAPIALLVGAPTLTDAGPSESEAPADVETASDAGGAISTVPGAGPSLEAAAARKDGGGCNVSTGSSNARVWLLGWGLALATLLARTRRMRQRGMAMEMAERQA
jgi:hypothetical protein